MTDNETDQPIEKPSATATKIRKAADRVHDWLMKNQGQSDGKG